jgi:hypothetical protein
MNETSVEFYGNWKLVCFCALEACLKHQTYVNYGVRDYILNHKERFLDSERQNMIKIISEHLAGQPDQDFWRKFQSNLQEN